MADMCQSCIYAEYKTSKVKRQQKDIESMTEKYSREQKKNEQFAEKISELETQVEHMKQRAKKSNDKST